MKSFLKREFHSGRHSVPLKIFKPAARKSVHTIRPDLRRARLWKHILENTQQMSPPRSFDEWCEQLHVKILKRPDFTKTLLASMTSGGAVGALFGPIGIAVGGAAGYLVGTLIKSDNIEESEKEIASVLDRSPEANRSQLLINYLAKNEYSYQQG